ncbi:MAG: protein BatD [Candidatus Hydrogenedens sp.]|nr:protein BatD [Candidatus Hydrogenedens sp.]
MIRISLYSLIFCLAAAMAGAQAPVSITASTSKAAANETFYITVSASGGDVQQPDTGVWQRAGFKTGSPSSQSSTSIQSVNGQTTVVQSRSWRYPMAVETPGRHTLPPLSVQVDGVHHMTQPITLEISEKIATPHRRSADGSSQDNLAVDDLAFVRAVTDKTTVYQGEAILLRLLIYVLDDRFVNLDGPRQLPLPATEGFFSGAQWQNNYADEYRGRNYRVTEFNQTLFPAMPGELTIDSWTWQGSVRWQEGGLRRQGATRLFSTHPVPIVVLPLPEGAPPGFSGAVGKFRMQTRLSSPSVAQGTPVRLTVTLTGEGNPQTIGMPTVEKLAWAHVSEPESEVKQSENSQEVSKSYVYLITPLEAGEHTIPPVTFSYFAPVLKNYKTESSQQLPLLVSATGEAGRIVAVGGSADAARQQIEINNQEGLPIITDSRLNAPSQSLPVKSLSVMELAGPLVSAVLVIICALFLAWRRRLTGDTGYARRFHARSHCLRSLLQAEGTADAHSLIYQALCRFVADWLNIKESGLTSGDIQQHLREAQLNTESVEMTLRILRACERAAYGGRDRDAEDTALLLQTAREAVDILQQAFQEVGK